MPANQILKGLCPIATFVESWSIDLRSLLQKILDTSLSTVFCFVDCRVDFSRCLPLEIFNFSSGLNASSWRLKMSIIAAYLIACVLIGFVYYCMFLCADLA